jgi:hypothetical protein
MVRYFEAYLYPMKKILLASLLVYGNAFAQTYVVKENSAGDQTASLQKAFNDPANKLFIISSAVIINGTVTVPTGKIIKFEGGRFGGKGIINGGIIEANYHVAIFDTTLTVNPKAVNQFFSVKWFGASGNNTDDHTAIQKSINTCIKNNIRTVYLPAGKYTISKPLIILNAGTFLHTGDAG